MVVTSARLVTVLMFVLLSVIAQCPWASAALTSFDVGIGREEYDKAECVLAGRIIKTRALADTRPWWQNAPQDGPFEPCEADFAVDNVIRGSATLAGVVVRVRYIGTRRNYMGVNAPLDFSDIVGNKRCLIATLAVPDVAGTYRLCGEVGSRVFALAGQRPDVSGWEKMTEDQRLDLEIGSAIASDDRVVAFNGISLVMDLKPTGKNVIDALRLRTTDKDAELASAAIAGLVDLNDTPTVYELPALLDSVHGGKRIAGGFVASTLEAVRDPDLVPALVALADCRDKLVKAAAIRSLRQIKSEKAVAALAGALGAEDQRVQYDAIMGLANQTDRMNPQWAWGFDHFRQNPKELADKWKGWWEQEGKAQYPSIETVLKEYEQTKETLEKERKPVPIPASPPPPETPPLAASATNAQPPTPPGTGWFSGNRLLLVISGLCVVAGFALYWALRPRKRSKGSAPPGQ